MANLLRFKLTDIDGSIIYIPNSAGWTLTIKETKESSAINISGLATGLATISLEGYGNSVGFVRGIVVTFKNFQDHVWNTTMIGSMGFDYSDLTPPLVWTEITNIKCYVYSDALTANGALTFDIIPF